MTRPPVPETIVEWVVPASWSRVPERSCDFLDRKPWRGVIESGDRSLDTLTHRQAFSAHGETLVTRPVWDRQAPRAPAAFNLG